jgi:hypothetical protein
MTAARWIGLDFSTTNSAVALADACGRSGRSFSTASEKRR